MFNNLIESSSHRKEFKRRGSFFLFTVGTYFLLFVVTGVASIYAYDANLGQQNYEITWLPPVTLEEPTTTSKDDKPMVRQGNDDDRSNVTERTVPMVSVNRPEVPPIGVSTTPNKNPPIPDHGLWRLSNRNKNAYNGGGSGPAIDGSRMVQPTGPIQIDIVDPPPAPAATPPKILKVSKVLNSQALSLPRPTYPIIARQMRLQGVVNVQVLIDENGRVVSAKAVSGPGVLIPAAQQAAMQARFSPTIIGEQPVKVSGVITYNFVMQ
jgi:protein TonB